MSKPVSARLSGDAERAYLRLSSEKGWKMGKIVEMGILLLNRYDLNPIDEISVESENKLLAIIEQLGAIANQISSGGPITVSHITDIAQAMTPDVADGLTELISKRRNRA